MEHKGGDDSAQSMPLFLLKISSAALGSIGASLGGCGFADKAVMRSARRGGGGGAARAPYLGRSIGLIMNARERGRLALPSVCRITKSVTCITLFVPHAAPPFSLENAQVEAKCEASCVGGMADASAQWTD